MPTSARAPPIGLPTFCDSMRASSSVCSSTSVATRRIRLARSVGETARHAGKAALARATAASVSSRPASGSSAIVSSVAGLTTAGTASFEHAAAPARRAALLALQDADDVPLGVGEHAEGDHLHLGDGHDGLSAELLRLVEHFLRILSADVERDVAVAVRRLPDAGADGALARVVRPIRDVARNLVDLPAEEIAVEALQLLAVLADHFDPRDLVRHLVLLPVGDFPGYDEHAGRDSTTVGSSKCERSEPRRGGRSASTRPAPPTARSSSCTKGRP